MIPAKTINPDGDIFVCRYVNLHTIHQFIDTLLNRLIVIACLMEKTFTLGTCAPLSPNNFGGEFVNCLIMHLLRKVERYPARCTLVFGKSPEVTAA